MRLWKVAGGAVLGVMTMLAIPASASADHRHSRHCDHRDYYSDYRYDDGYGYGDGYRDDYRYDYRYDYRPRYEYRYRDYRPYRYRYYGRGPGVGFHFHGGRRCSRSHVSLHFGW